MATTKSFGWTNTTQSTKALTLTKMGLESNYGCTPTVGNCTYKNTGNPLNQDEVIQLFGGVKKSLKTYAPLANPDPDPNYDEFTVRNDSVLRVTYEDGRVVDTPIVCQIKMSYQLSDQVTDTDLEAVLLRALSALYDDAGNPRISLFARNVYAVNAD